MNKFNNSKNFAKIGILFTLLSPCIGVVLFLIGNISYSNMLIDLSKFAFLFTLFGLIFNIIALNLNVNRFVAYSLLLSIVITAFMVLIYYTFIKTDLF